MRIGIFTSSLPEPHLKPGGVDVFVDRLGDSLAGRGHEVTVFSYTPARPDAVYKSAQLTPAARAHDRLARLTTVPLALNRLDTSSLDVLHLHGDDWFFVSRRVPTVRTFHGSALYEARTATSARRRLSQALTFGLEVMSSRLATRSYTVAPPAGGAYRPRGVLPLAVDLPHQVETARPHPPSVLFVGTWSGRKRGELLYQAFHRHVLPELPDAELHMVSDHCPSGPNVTWWDRPSDVQIAELHRRAWVFCLPSRYEGFGLPYAEAMAAGTPVVSTANPGAAHVLDGGRAGLIVSDEELGQRLLELLRDRELRERLARAGRQRVRSFSWEATAEAHERAYTEAMTAFTRRWRLGRVHLASSACR